MADWFRFQQGSSFPHSSGARMVLGKSSRHGTGWMGESVCHNMTSRKPNHSEQLVPMLWGTASAIGPPGFSEIQLNPNLNKQTKNQTMYSGASAVSPKQLFQRGSEPSSMLQNSHCFMALSLPGFPPYCCHMATELKKATRKGCRTSLLLGGPLLMGEIKSLSENEDGYNTAISSNEHASHQCCNTFLQNLQSTL